MSFRFIAPYLQPQLSCLQFYNNAYFHSEFSERCMPNKKVKMMTITIIYRRTETQIEKPVDLTVSKLLNQMNLLPEANLVIRKGELLTEHELIKDGDIIKIVPVISGGQL